MWKLGRRAKPGATNENPAQEQVDILDSIIIGAGQAGLSASQHLSARGITHVVLDANKMSGGAWQHRWKTLTMHDVHGIANLPDMPVPLAKDSAPARHVVPEYFERYEKKFELPIRRPARVSSVRSILGFLEVKTDVGVFTAKTLINATGTWTQPFIPFYPGADSFSGRQIHTVDYDGPEQFEGQRVIVVGGGASAVQILGELAGVAETIWATRKPPVWREGPFTAEEGRKAVAVVEEQVRQGFTPQSIVSVTGLRLRPQEQRAAELGAYERQPMFSSIEPEGVRWSGTDSDEHFERADAIVWATGFRPAIGHLAPLHLRDKNGGIKMDGPTAVEDARIQLVGYGPSASTIGANRAGRQAAVAVERFLKAESPDP